MEMIRAREKEWRTWQLSVLREKVELTEARRAERNRRQVSKKKKSVFFVSSLVRKVFFGSVFRPGEKCGDFFVALTVDIVLCCPLVLS